MVVKENFAVFCETIFLSKYGICLSSCVWLCVFFFFTLAKRLKVVRAPFFNHHIVVENEKCKNYTSLQLM